MFTCNPFCSNGFAKQHGTERKTELSGDNCGFLYYTLKDGALYSKDETKLIYYPSCKRGRCVIPDGVTEIGDGAFAHCTRMDVLMIPHSVTRIGERAFCDCYFTNLVIPDGVISIGEMAFVRCGNLHSVSLPNSLTSIGDHAFWNCKSLPNIIIPQSVTSIGMGAFAGCEALTSATVMNEQCNIGGDSFPCSLIRGYIGSTAESYASAWGKEFEALS